MSLSFSATVQESRLRLDDCKPVHASEIPWTSCIADQCLVLCSIRTAFVSSGSLEVDMQASPDAAGSSQVATLVDQVAQKESSAATTGAEKTNMGPPQPRPPKVALLSLMHILAVLGACMQGPARGQML